MANVGALQVILSSSLALIDSVFLCAVVNLDFFTFFWLCYAGFGFVRDKSI